ncbi:hypothetical protein HYW46_05115 [Candidatus Daviesbacteria bacterium]|nr:hypothetical protein [Candidatus Daviesbacteria bacterium]
MSDQNSIPADIRVFLESLLEDAGMTITDELKEPMIMDLYTRLEKKMITDALEKMKPEEADEFVKLIQSNAPQDQVNGYISNHIPNAKEVFLASLTDFRTYFLSGTMQGNQVSQ